MGAAVMCGQANRHAIRRYDVFIGAKPKRKKTGKRQNKVFGLTLLCC